MTTTTIRVGWTDLDVAVESHRDHILAATRWQSTCLRCGQSIPRGAVGVATWCDDRRCNIGGRDYQHRCGEWNTPTEVEAHISDYEGFADPAAAALDALLDELTAQITAEIADAVAKRRTRLVGNLADAIVEIRGAGYDPATVTDDEMRDCMTGVGSDATPGVWRNGGGRLEAWDFHPFELDETIEVCEADL